jgi:hypothetical protein
MYSSLYFVIIDFSKGLVGSEIETSEEDEFCASDAERAVEDSRD